MVTRRQQDQQQSRVLCEMSALVFDLLRTPPVPLPLSEDGSPAVVVPVPPSACRRSQEITLSGLASLLLGISMALMLCGSVIFFLGFMLMPWVVGLVMVLYVAGVVSTLSTVGRSIICFFTPRKDVPEWKLL